MAPMRWKSFTQTPTPWPVSASDAALEDMTGQPLLSPSTITPLAPPPLSGVLKSYLRELPQPLMTFELYDEWLQVAR